MLDSANFPSSTFTGEFDLSLDVRETTSRASVFCSLPKNSPNFVLPGKSELEPEELDMDE
jgi:hypothetical protein